jgi:flagellar hook-associated protein 1 FlgK
MGGFNVSFGMAAGAMDAIQQALDAVQNNIVNSSTPGYAAEQVNFSAQAFDVQQGLAGGVEVSLSSTRDLYLEQSVRTETSALGLLQQQDPLLSSLQSAFSASGDSGVPGALTGFASAFSTLSTSPNSASAQANVLQAAATLAQAFNQTATQISNVSSEAVQQADSTVSQINSLTAQIAALNTQIQGGAQNDSGVQANLSNSLQTLSGLVNISVNYAPDGSASVLLDGQTALVTGQTANTLSISQPNSTGDLQLLDQAGQDVTAQATQGQLGGLLQVQNQTIPQSLGQVNQLAQSLADRVNTILTSGQVSAGPPPVPGTALFTYTSAATAAATLSVNPSITASQIATIDPGPPVSSNGVALELASINDPTNSADMIGGQSYTSFYGQIAAEAGNASSENSANLTAQQDLTTQAQNQLSQASGVSLNDQAAQLMALQTAYQATAKVITVLQTITQTAVDLIPETPV